MIPEYAQLKIARTNGRLWQSRVGRLKELPIPKIPLPAGDGGLLLDIGCGWGRWMAAAARRGYVPVGIDIQLDAARATLQTLRSLGLRGYVVVGDLQHLPFAPDVFSATWSFSVLQHAHRKYVASCLDGILHSLKPGGFAELEFPTRWGVRNMLTRALRHVDEDELDSWCVRYYALSELRELMESRFDEYGYRAHCFFGTGILPDDLRLAPKRFAPLILGSLCLTGMTRVIPPLTRLADSVYVRGVKAVGAVYDRALCPPTGISILESDPPSNLDILPLLRCPATGAELEWDRKRDRLISPAGLEFPVVDDIPVLLHSM